MRQRNDSVTVSGAIGRKIDTQKNKTRTGHWQDRDKGATPVMTARNASACEVTSKLATNWNNSYLLSCWLCISSGNGLHLWLLGALVYLTLFGINTVENSWDVKWIHRYLTRNIKPFGLSSICVVCNINKTGTREWQHRWQHAMDPLARSIPS